LKIDHVFIWSGWFPFSHLIRSTNRLATNRRFLFSSSFCNNKKSVKPCGTWLLLPHDGPWFIYFFQTPTVSQWNRLYIELRSPCIHTPPTQGEVTEIPFIIPSVVS
jgi:hypothetical protein